MSRMLEAHPQMVDAISKLLVWDDVLLERVACETPKNILRFALASIDREKMIETAARALATERVLDSTFGSFEMSGFYIHWAETALVAAGVIPEREQSFVLDMAACVETNS